MCDTVGRIINSNYALFLKNSDRAVNEPQVVEFYQAKNHSKEEKLKCTYIEIEQVSHTNAIVLSRPVWIWGGEIGVNEYGVCIGNEAVFTKGRYGKDALIGMDLLRLGLERGDSAKKSLEIIIELLEKYGQGGNCGYDSNFHYDNSFLIMDRKEIYVLETKDKDYVYKKYDHACISNHLTIGEDGDYYRNQKCNFNKKYSDLIMSFGSKGNIRQRFTSNHKLDNLEDAISILRSHDKKNIFLQGSVSSICMHASNSLTADQTTSSMIVELKNNDILIHLTGCSLPCVSLFKPALFKVNGLIFENKEDNQRYWKERELFNRRLVSCVLPKEYYEDLNNVQKEILSLPIDDINILKALELDRQFFDRWKDYPFKKGNSSIIYQSFWKKKNAMMD